MNYRSIALAIVMMVASAGAARASTLIIDGGFEGGADPGTFSTYGTGSLSLPGWTILSGSVDHIGTYWQPSEGSRSLDLSGNAPGAISQTFNTTIGQKYVVSFDLAGNPDEKETGVVKTIGTSIVTGLSTFASTFTFDVTNTSKANMGWTAVSYSFIAEATSATLFFQSLTNTAYGPALDNIAVAAVPLPASLPLFGAGLAGLAVMARRQRRANVRIG